MQPMTQSGVQIKSFSESTGAQMHFSESQTVKDASGQAARKCGKVQTVASLALTVLKTIISH